MYTVLCLYVSFYCISIYFLVVVCAALRAILMTIFRVMFDLSFKYSIRKSILMLLLLSSYYCEKCNRNILVIYTSVVSNVSYIVKCK